MKRKRPASAAPANAISRDTWAGKLAWLAMEWGRAYEAWETHGQCKAPTHRVDAALLKVMDDARQSVIAHLTGTPTAPEPFVVKHYSGTERPSIKGNGFDGLEIGEDREEAQAFVDWVNRALGVAPSDEPERLRKVIRGALYHLRDTNSGAVAKAMALLESEVGSSGVLPPTCGAEGFHCAREGMCDATPRCTVQCVACGVKEVKRG